MPSEPAPTTQKRGPGRPKGSKNKESAGAVGRPPKGGGPPRKNQPSSGSDIAERSQDSSTGTRLKQTKLSFVVPAPKGPCAREPPKSQDRPHGSDSGIAADVPVVARHSNESTAPPERAVEPASHTMSNATDSDTLAPQNAAAQDGAATRDNVRGRDATSMSYGRDPTAAVAPRVAISAESTLSAGSSGLISGSSSTVSSSSATGSAPAVHQKGADAPQRARAQGGPSKTKYHGQDTQACPEYVPGPSDLSGVDDVDIDYLLGETGEDANEEGEFQPIPDDDEPILASSETAVPRDPPADGSKCREIQSRSTMPLWLKSIYSEMRERLISEMKTNASRRPTCYDQGSYTIGGPISFYNANHKIVSPADFYRPFFFVWLPHLFLKDGILCPACVHARRTRRSNNQPVTLQLNGWPDSPRRVTDIEYNLFLVGQRYRCGHPDCNKTYQPWSPAILDVLPPALAAQFTLSLTYRGGLTDRLAALLRSSFRNGVGPTAFKDMINSFHHRYYEQLHIRYLEHVCSRQQGLVGGLYGEPNNKFTWFGKFDDRNRYAGSVPSRNYFQLFYGHYLSPWAHDMNKRMAMLSARYLAVDHSHKLSKRLAKVAGQTVFGALHTTVNEYGEIRQMTLTPTKGHDQFMPALGQMPDSLVSYGHGDIELVFTDSTRADKAELERIFPMLLRNVHPVPNHSLLPPLEIPPDWSTWILSSEYQIRNRITCIMDDLAKLDDTEELKVGFDMEWPVDRINGIQGRVAILQISYRKDIFILQLRTFLQDGFLHLPPVLLTFLRSSRIRKVGVHVKADLTRLFKDCQQNTKTGLPFSGALELGQLAKVKNAADKANIGLADLVARTLHRCLDKDESTRISNHWSDAVLTKQQEQYAASDVYACWSVFEILESSPSPGAPVTLQSPEGTPVELLARDCTQVIARGILLSDRPKECRGVQGSKARALVKVTQIEVPGYCIPANLSPTKEPVSLSALQEKESLPITLYFKFAHLRTSVSLPSTPMSQPPHLEAASSAATYSANVPSTSALHVTISSLLQESSGITACETSDESPRDVPLSDMTDTGDDDPTGSWYDEIEYDPAIEQVPEMAHSDATSAQRAQQLRSTVKSQEPPVIRSRVLGDIWHLMDQFKIAVHHGLRRPFARALRDAIFIPDPEDKAAIEDVLKKRGTSFKAMFLSHPEWILRRMKRQVPEPDTLLSRVSEVLFTYGPLKDAKTGQPLFNDTAWDTVRNVLENIRRGYYSDPPGLSLYFVRGRDKDGLYLYRSLRGTNHVEGGVHQNIIQRFSAYNASPEFAVNLLRDYALCHNLRVGTYNRTGLPYQGSYDIWQRNRISHLMDLTEDSIEHPAELRSSWVNTWDYKDTNESFGILPIAPSTRASLGMLDYDADFSHSHKTRHRWLADAQQTRHAVLPVHTAEERALFRLLAGDTKGLFAGKASPNWIAVAAEWSSHCDGQKIFYKLPEHLKTYFKTWHENCNEQNSIEDNRAAYERIRTALSAQVKSLPILPADQPAPLSSQIAPSESNETTGPSSWHISALLGSHSTRQSLIQHVYGENAPAAASSFSGNKRRASASAGSSTLMPVDGDAHGTKRRRRTCVRCKRTDCAGAFRSRPCDFLPPVEMAT